MRSFKSSSSLASVALAGLLIAGVAQANPVDGVVSAGSATISNVGTSLNIHQSTDKAVIDWRSFNIAPNETTQFHQPSSSSMTLNRVSAGNPSQIMGSLVANGNVVIVNPSGVLFGKDSQVDVNGLVATTSNVTNSNFMAGNLAFEATGEANARIENQGRITAKDAGLVGLVAPNVSNSGVITAKLGKVQLASGDRFSVDMYGDGLMNVAVSDAVQHQLVENSGAINAEGGTIAMTAATGAQVVNSLINITGELNAPTVSTHKGKIIIGGDVISHTGTMNVSGTNAGSVAIRGNKIANQGKIKANSSAGTGGDIDIAFGKAYLDSESAEISATSADASGGHIGVIGDVGSRAFISGAYDVSSSTHTGGKAQITAEAGDLKLFGARVNADGKTGGGTINIGGEFQGRGTLAHANTTSINYATYLSANAIDSGNGGEVVVWSDETTKFGGHAFARGGSISGNGGLIELSSKNELHIAGNAETSASAANGQAGQLLLDPKNIIIANGGISGGGISSFEFVDPNADTGNFGGGVIRLSSGNVVITDPLDDFVATDSGAVYLFNAATGGLISTLTGSTADDNIGYDGITTLTNGNFVISSKGWDSGAVVDAGAATWASGTTGASGIVSAANSLVGTVANDMTMNGGLVIALTNGNYLVNAYNWDNGGAVDAGAVTWGNGLGGTVGAISSANSLVGTTANDRIGSYEAFPGFALPKITTLANGNYVVLSQNWDNGAATDAGAVTWGNGLGGTVGAVNASNSLVGTTTDDQVGYGGVTELTNGNYVVNSWAWDGIGKGAVTWGSGTSGVSGVISAANSLIGSGARDYVGNGGIIALTNGNYVVTSNTWGSGDGDYARSYGAATWGNGATGTVGIVSAANSLVTDYRSGGAFMFATALTNGNYVVSLPWWVDSGPVQRFGAVAWGNGTTGTSGIVSATNSLVGSHNTDNIGSTILALSNGNYVVESSSWNSSAGAVTWGNGSGGTVGAISAANSLIGSTPGEGIGSNGVIELSNGNYLVSSAYWDNGGIVNAGAVTWGNGLGGTVGTVSAMNSLVGTTADDRVGEYVYKLANNNYVVVSSNWDNGAIVDVGAVTWGNGLGGTVGAVSSSNSLVGTTADDQVGYYGFVALSNGNYLVNSYYWDNGSVQNVGAVTWGNGLGGTVGAVSSSNSLVGSSSGDITFGYLPVELSNGNYVVNSQYWDNGSIVDAGAVTWGSGTSGVSGVISSTNSLVGTTANDQVGSGGVFKLANGNYVVNSYEWDNGAVADAGAVTIGNGLGGTVGVINSSNSLIGASANAMLSFVGYDSVNGRFIAASSASQRVYSFTLGNSSLGDYDAYADMTGSTVTLAPGFLTAVLNAGTSVVLQASNDITVTDDIIANNGSGNGGALTLQAGRSILINADITTDNGDLNLFANERLATGVVNAQRDAGAAAITMGVGAAIDAGTGNVTIRLDDGLGKTNFAAGDISLRDITANTILARNNNSTGDIVLSTGALTANGAGDAIILSSLRNFINDVGASALSTSAGRWLVYSTNPAGDTINGLVSAFSRFSCTYGGSCPTLAAGNGLLYSYTPTVTVTASPVVPNTVLYVSQTPNPSILPLQVNPVESASSGANMLSSDAATTQHDISFTKADGGLNSSSYSLLNGWIIIDPQLVRMLGIDQTKI